MLPSPLLDLLAESRALGFLGPGDVAFHVEHALAFGELIGEHRSVVDLGSGGGVPGLTLAVHRPDLRIAMVDVNARRCAFLRAALDALSLGEASDRESRMGDRVSVVEGRAEELARRVELRGQFDAVVSRSFGAPSVTAECAVGFLEVGGQVIVSEPPDVAESDRRWPADGLAELGLHDGGRVVAGRFGFRRLVAGEPCPSTYPRRVGVPAKRPLFASA